MSFNPRPDGVFPDPARRWGQGIRPVICQASRPILDQKTAFDSSGLELPEYVSKFYLNDVTDDVTGRVKGQIFILSLLASLGKAAVSNRNKANGTAWIVSGIPLTVLLSLLLSDVKS